MTVKRRNHGTCTLLCKKNIAVYILCEKIEYRTREKMSEDEVSIERDGIFYSFETATIHHSLSILIMRACVASFIFLTHI